MARSVGLTYDQVITAAAELADAQGLDLVTLAQLASRLGIRLPSLYNYFDGLPGLRHHLALWGGRRLVERISKAAIGKSSDAALIAIAQEFRTFILEHPGVYAATVRAPAVGDVELEQLSQELIGVIVAVLEPYGLSEDSLIHAVRGLRSIVHGFATIEIGGGFELPQDRGESFLRLLRAYLAGLHAHDVF
jgi:AcrR family transcriptional regulator